MYKHIHIHRQTQTHRHISIVHRHSFIYDLKRFFWHIKQSNALFVKTFLEGFGNFNQHGRTDISGQAIDG